MPLPPPVISTTSPRRSFRLLGSNSPKLARNMQTMMRKGKSTACPNWFKSITSLRVLLVPEQKSISTKSSLSKKINCLNARCWKSKYRTPLPRYKLIDSHHTRWNIKRFNLNVLYVKQPCSPLSAGEWKGGLYRPLFVTDIVNDREYRPSNFTVSGCSAYLFSTQ